MTQEAVRCSRCCTLATGVPLLDDCLIVYDCRVINTMDAGASTFFLLEPLSQVVEPLKSWMGPTATP